MLHRHLTDLGQAHRRSGRRLARARRPATRRSRVFRAAARASAVAGRLCHVVAVAVFISATETINQTVRFERPVNQLPDAEHDVLVRYEAVSTVFGALPPIARHLSVQREEVALFEAELAGGTSLEVELSRRLERFSFCKSSFTNQ